MPVLWIMLLAGLGALSVLLLAPLRARLYGGIAFPEGGMLTLEASALFGLVRLRFRFLLNLLRRPSIAVLWLKENGDVRCIWDISHTLLPKNDSGRFGTVLLQAAGKHWRLYRLHISGEAGVRDDPFVTAALVGILCIAMQVRFLRALNEKQQQALHVFVRPDFTRSVLRLNLEGIAAVSPMQIITAVILRWLRQGWQKKQRKEGNAYVASD